MKALVTGVGGFCGSHLVARLRQEAGLEILGLDRMVNPPAQLGAGEYLKCDIAEDGAIDSAIESFKPDWIFHLAGLSGDSRSPACIYEVNVTGSVRLLEAVRRRVPECRVLLVGSFAEYGCVDPSLLPVSEETACRPVGAYGISKYAASLTGMDYARRLGLKVIVARPSNIVGSGIASSLVVGAMLVRAKVALASAHRVMKVGDFDSERDFIAATDAVDAYVRLVQSGISGEIFNICSGRSYSIKHIAELLVANSHRPITLQFDPELVRPSAIRRIFGSGDKAERAIGFRPSSPIEEALRAAWSAEIGTGATCESRC
jgi:GDP-4-dehydro-6-deoxy-D-mannose reductase